LSAAIWQFAAMTRKIRTALPALALSLFVAISGLPALADDQSKDDKDHTEARALLQRGEILPLTQILKIALENVPGDVIDVELDREDTGWQYEVKVLTATGRVREVKLNAQTAKVLEIEDD
jgi:uncharacterized membrane protein YkoI